MDAMRLAFDEIKSEIKRVLVKYGMPEEKAETCARIHTETAYDGYILMALTGWPGL